MTSGRGPRRDLDAIVGALARRIEGYVAIDDAALENILAFSSHTERADRVRRESILGGAAPDEAVAGVRSLGIDRAERPLRIPANAELEMEARVCARLEVEGELYGFLWVLDEDSGLTDAALAEIEVAAAEAALVLHHDRLTERIERGQERELLRDLISERAEVRRHAAELIVERDLWRFTGPSLAFVVQPAHAALEPDDAVRAAIGAALQEARRLLARGGCLHLVRVDRGLLLAAAREPLLRTRGVHALGEELADACACELPDGWRAVVGVGDPVEALTNVATAYEQARRAARVGGLVRSFGRVVTWKELGVYRILSRLQREDLQADLLHVGLLRLLQRHDATLTETLERYLDRAGDAQATAQDLHIHRGTLYYRLQKVQEITELDLRIGDDRLLLHLGLKLARMSATEGSADALAGADQPSSR